MTNRCKKDMDHPFIRFGKNVVEQYSEFQRSCRPVDEAVDVAALIGFQDKEQLDIWNALFFQDLSVQGMRATLDSMCQLLPAGLNVVGFLQVSSQEEFVPDECTVEQCPCFELFDLLDSCPLRILAVCAKERLMSADIDRIFCYAYSKCGSRLIHSYFNPVSWASFDEFRRNTLSICVELQLPLNIVLKTAKDRENFGNLVCDKFKNIKSRIETEDLYLQTMDKATLFSLSSKDNNVSVIGKCDADSSCFHLWSLLYVPEQEPEKKKRKELCFNVDSISLKLLQKVTSSEPTKPFFNCVPIIYCEKGEFQQVSVPLKLNSVAIVNQTTELTDVGQLLKCGILRQLQSAENCIRHHSKLNELKLCAPQPYLFLPTGFPHFVSLHYPSSYNDRELEEFRQSLHMILNLPLGRPLLRRTNKYIFPNDYGPYLRNIHTYVGKSGVDGVVSLVEGDYQYHHYMQDGFNDQGWGCAYRSFQTVWSWFLLQGYTDKPIPTHIEIQEVLVAIGDKEGSFIGSKQWVGSLELSYCLNQMLDVTSRIGTASSGEEMSTKARELAFHFQTQGTPVMIGGGVLAHTILGVDFNEDTGDLKFLVLDPHYTGEENVKTIIEKGWCGWKPVTFWEQNCFYNMLLPQRPHVI